MVGRCHRPTDSSYKYYGAKGVTVCDRWRKFEDFFSDMGTAPDGMHLHRTNGSSVYSKETCQWLNESEHIGLHNMEQGWGARMNRTQLIDALAGTKADLMRLERDWHKVINEVLKCNPIPARDRTDDQLEPPWEVIARIRQQLAAERSIKSAVDEITKNTELQNQLAAERELADIGRKWKTDSSLESWFPFTAEEIQQLREQLAAKDKEIASDNLQLAAERENFSTAADYNERLSKINTRLREQLAAERETTEDTRSIAIEAQEENKLMREQIATERGNAEKAAARAELAQIKVQTLVELIEQIPDGCGFGGAGEAYGILTNLVLAKRKLAKVKEEKQ